MNSNLQPQDAKKLQQQQLKQLARLKGQMRQLKNEMDFIEILSNFWPLPNMMAKVERLERQMSQLNHQYEQQHHHTQQLSRMAG